MLTLYLADNLALVSRRDAKAPKSRTNLQPDSVRDGQARAGGTAREFAQARATILRAWASAWHIIIHRGRPGRLLLPTWHAATQLPVLLPPEIPNRCN